ncbi:MAG: hypothetical protein DLM53_11340 [Candidatus Eremiobacter antarcticus]|nr:MAG: hypothetical protein DLM53_11340 [Candidatus Eremiobacter sp. RRmetagenome_bin22]
MHVTWLVAVTLPSESPQPCGKSKLASPPAEMARKLSVYENTDSDDERERSRTSLLYCVKERKKRA